MKKKKIHKIINNRRRNKSGKTQYSRIPNEHRDKYVWKYQTYVVTHKFGEIPTYQCTYPTYTIARLVVARCSYDILLLRYQIHDTKAKSWLRLSDERVGGGGTKKPVKIVYAIGFVFASANGYQFCLLFPFYCVTYDYQYSVLFTFHIIHIDMKQIRHTGHTHTHKERKKGKSNNKTKLLIFILWME